MIKKILVFIFIACGLVATFWITGRLTNTFQFFSTSTSANHPTIKRGDLFFASRLIKPKRFDFICYYAYAPVVGRQIWTHRLCGLEGDKVEIIAGKLYVNDRSPDDNLTLSHNYLINEAELYKVKEIGELDEGIMQQISRDTFVTYFSDKTVTTHNIRATRHTLPREYKDEFINQLYASQWNQDNFGPLIVPINKYFVLGDNRLNAQDSRYLGLIDKNDYVATVLWRK